MVLLKELSAGQQQNSCSMQFNKRSTNDLWDNFCRLRLASRAYRAVDDPIVARAHADWLASYLADCEVPQATNVIPFRKARGQS
jgi:hypothetical protein